MEGLEFVGDEMVSGKVLGDELVNEVEVKVKVMNCNERVLL